MLKASMFTPDPDPPEFYVRCLIVVGIVYFMVFSRRKLRASKFDRQVVATVVLLKNNKRNLNLSLL